jgi:hypothetical protein
VTVRFTVGNEDEAGSMKTGFNQIDQTVLGPHGENLRCMVFVCPSGPIRAIKKRRGSRRPKEDFAKPHQAAQTGWWFK